jgi:hypothetical protein
MNLLTFGSVTGVALGALYPVVSYFIPPRAAGGGGGTTAKDELGNTVTATGWLSTRSTAGPPPKSLKTVWYASCPSPPIPTIALRPWWPSA